MISVPLNVTKGRYQLAGVILYSFLLTFIVARVTVFLLMANKIPCIFLKVGGYHIHHYIYGIIIVTLTGGFTILAQPQGRLLLISACLYGIGSALIYDEFSLLIYLWADSYTWRLSWDIVTMIVIVTSLITYMPFLKVKKQSDRLGALILFVFLLVYGSGVYLTIERLTRLRGHELYYLEKNGGNACLNNFYYKNK